MPVGDREVLAELAEAVRSALPGMRYYMGPTSGASDTARAAYSRVEDALARAEGRVRRQRERDGVSR